MSKFPDRKADKDALYSAIVAGIIANPSLYPNSGPTDPFNTAAFSTMITAKNTAKNTRQNEEGQFRAAVVVEETAYDNCDDEARRLLNLAIATHGVNSANLVHIGWGPPAAPTSNVPGQARTLEAVVQGPGDCFLDWKAPAPLAGTGLVAFYRIQRRVRTLQGVQSEDWGVWERTTTDSEISLSGLDRGVEYDFRVIASNGSGDGVPSNVVTVVL